MYISNFRVQNFKIHRDSTIDLYPITVLVGPNGGGKSALFDALTNFSMVSRGKLSEAFGPGPYSFQEVRAHGGYRSERIRYEIVMQLHSNSKEALKYEISYGEVAPRYVIFDEKVTRLDTGECLFDRSNQHGSAMAEVLPFVRDDTSVFAAVRRAQATGEYVDHDSLVTHCAREISRVTKFRLDPSNLSKPSTRADLTPGETERTLTPRLTYGGGNLAGVIAYLEETADASLERIIEQATKVIPEFQGFELNTVGTNQVGFSVQYSDQRGLVPAANLSDGTLSLLGILVLLAGADRPPVLCLEEPENGMTPASTSVVYEALRDVALISDPDQQSQVLLSSHSPFVICDAWNGDDRDFIYQLTPTAGGSLIRSFRDIIEEHQIQLRMEGGVRRGLGLEVANQVMSGYLS